MHAGVVGLTVMTGLGGTTPAEFDTEKTDEVIEQAPPSAVAMTVKLPGAVMSKLGEAPLCLETLLSLQSKVTPAVGVVLSVMVCPEQMMAGAGFRIRGTTQLVLRIISTEN